MRRAAGILMAVAALLGACSTNPATGERQFTGLMSRADERRLGAEEHAKVLDEFGGAYNDPKVQAYVDRVAQKVAATTEGPETRYTVTVIDSDIVNAFALPGGYVYVTRGLLALANNEAELAGVLGHEIGHVTARHTAERQGQGTLAQVGAVLATVLGGEQLGQVAGVGANLVLSGFSRSQELEADSLGVRYMARAGYDPQQMSAFLASLGRDAELQAELAGNDPESANQFSYFQTHPPTGERVRKAAEAASARPADQWRVGRSEYLAAMEGLLYGDSPANGFVRGRAFIHPRMGFRFEVPPGFRLLNGAQQVTATAKDQDAVIVFDMAPSQGARAPADYIRSVWAAEAAVGELQSMELGGLPAATAVTRAQLDQGPALARLVAIRRDEQSVYRFLFLTGLDADGRHDPDFRQTLASFRRLSPQEAAQYRPYRIRVITARPGDTVASLARRMPFGDHAEERLRVLNALSDGQEPAVGQPIKLIVE
jgi:predicted Zn-dependent protease